MTSPTTVQKNNTDNVFYIEDIVIQLNDRLENKFLADLSDKIKQGIILTDKQHVALLQLIKSNLKLLKLSSNAVFVPKRRRLTNTKDDYIVIVKHKYIIINKIKNQDILDELPRLFPNIIIKKRFKDYYVETLGLNTEHLINFFVGYSYQVKETTKFNEIFTLENN